MTIRVRAQRSDGWWAIDFELDGSTFHTQSKTFDGIEGMVRDAATLLDVHVDDVSVSTPYGPAVDHVHVVSDEADRATREAQQARRDLARQLREEGLTLQDAAGVMGVSYQRVAQLSA